MRKPNKNPRRTFGVYMDQAEQEQMLQTMASTNCRSISEYIKKMIFSKPITILYRNQSFDDFTEAYIDFKKDLDIILEKGSFSNTEKEWLYGQIQFIRETTVKLYDYVRQNKSDKRSS